MVVNRSQCPQFEQKFVIKFLRAEKSKPCEIHRKIYDVDPESKGESM